MEFDLDKAVERVFASYPQDEISRRAQSIVNAWDQAVLDPLSLVEQAEDPKWIAYESRIQVILNGSSSPKS
ncbi:hypothetical protein HYS93_03735 [Candidatus Daviesbacteria bacterium]|nr:hypothetical protein [Candidatus Daviesbacteria bacterium]